MTRNDIGAGPAMRAAVSVLTAIEEGTTLMTEEGWDDRRRRATMLSMDPVCVCVPGACEEGTEAVAVAVVVVEALWSGEPISAERGGRGGDATAMASTGTGVAPALGRGMMRLLGGAACAGSASISVLMRTLGWRTNDTAVDCNTLFPTCALVILDKSNCSPDSSSSSTVDLHPGSTLSSSLQ